MFQPKCDFRSYSRSASGRPCGKDAVVAVEDMVWRNSKRIKDYSPRCRFHASIDAGRTYGPKFPVSITDEMLAQWEADAKERAEAQAKQAEEQRARRTIQVERDKSRAAQENLTEWTAVREDESQHDWSRPASEMATVQIPRWILQSNTDERGYSEVKVDRRDGYPDRLEVRHSSTMTINEARALVEALTAAIEEVS